MNFHIKPIIIIPSYKKYEDRALMFSSLIEQNIFGHIHFHNKQEKIESIKKYSCPYNNLSLLKWSQTLFCVIKWIIHNNQNIIIHDLFAPRGIFIPRIKKTVKVLSLYSDTANYYFGKRYKADIKNKNIFNKIYLHFLYIKRAIFEYVGIKLSDGIIVNSPEIIEGIKKHYRIRNKSFKVINTCVDTEFWKILDIEREQNMIFYAGRLSKRKGLDILLYSFNELVKSNRDLKLVIAGKETNEESFKWGRKYIENNGLADKVVILGEIHKQQMRVWYNKSSVFVLPSKQEGSPRVIKEAMACGCPVICSDIPGTRILDYEGKLINFLPENNERCLCTMIDSVLRGTNNSTEIRKYIINNFSPEIIARSTLDFYNEMIIKNSNI
jgi:glycosyltransferase involved in cell wall biosynthesis